MQKGGKKMRITITTDDIPRSFKAIRSLKYIKDGKKTAPPF